MNTLESANTRIVELEQDLRVLLSCMDDIDCSCLEPPEEDDYESPSAHSQYCQYYLIGYILAALQDRPRPA